MAYELGVAHATFGPKGTLLLIEEGIERPSNIDGMQVIYVPSKNIAKKFGEIREHLCVMGLLE